MLGSLSGCVWLRLLDMKSQFAKFDENFRIESGEHFVVHFLHPVLYLDDFSDLSKMEPTRVERTASGKRSLQIYRKLDAHGKPQPGTDIVFTLDFDKDDKLTQWDFSPVFMAMAPAPFFEASLRSLGKGKVDENKRQLQVSPADLPKVTAPPPKRAAIVNLLGQPHEQRKDKDGPILVYRFEMETPRVEEGYADRKNTNIQFLIDPKTDDVMKMSGKFAGLKISINFRKLKDSVQIPMETVR
jgi:hypothetical protein